MIGTRQRSGSAVRRAAHLRRFHADVLRGLRCPQKELPCKYFYDETGSDLFERITQLDEYYPTRTELGIMRQQAHAMAELMGPECLLIEYGSGSSTKTRLLLDHLWEPAGYVPVDISSRYLRRSARKLAEEYPALAVTPLCADFTLPLRLPNSRNGSARRVVYFPGSTIGNLSSDQAIVLLRQTGALVGPGGGLLIGADLQKDPHVIEAAYNDSQGVTAAFNRNLLVRINRELGGDFAVDDFAHHAFYDAAAGRIEMHLLSRRRQCATIGEAEFYFASRESIRTEYSHKYTIPMLRGMAAAAGFSVQRIWTDDRDYFSVSFLAASQPGRCA